MRKSGFGFASALAALALCAAPAAAQQQQFEVKIGVLNDMSSLYQDTTGPGSLLGVQMAVEDYMKANPKSALKVTVISADHQNKPDIGSNIARQWYQVENVDAIIDVPNSAVALAVADITKQYNKVNLNASAGTTRLTGDACNANLIHWNSIILPSPTARGALSSQPAATPGFSSPPIMLSVTTSRRRHPPSSSSRAAM